MAQRLAEHVLTCWTAASPRGNDTLVPPWKSMPRVKPRIAMLAIAIAMIRPLMVNHSLRLPTTSNAPVPV